MQRQTQTQTQTHREADTQRHRDAATEAWDCACDSACPIDGAKVFTRTCTKSK